MMRSLRCLTSRAGEWRLVAGYWMSRAVVDPQETVASSRSSRSRTNNDAAASCDGRSPQRLGRENMLTRFPSGSRSKSERLPHGINVVGITMFVPDAFIRSNTASTSSTSNSRIAD